MAIKFNRSQTFATNGTVTAAALHNLIDGTDIYQALITDQTAMTSVGSLDKLLIADSDLTAGDAPRSVTVNELFEDALTLSTYTNVKAVNSLYTNATGNYTLSTGATITNGTITNGVIPTGTFGTTTSTAATITTGTIPTLTAGTTTSTAANITTGTLTNLVATTSTFNGTITGSTNVINIGSGQIYKDASGNVGIGTTSPTGELDVYNATNTLAIVQGDSTTNLYTHRASTDNGAASMAIRKSRGSIASPTAVATGDAIGNINFIAYGGTSERPIARIRGSVEAYVSDSDISSNLIFQTSAAGGVTATERLRIASAGQIGIGGANYGTSGQVLVSNGASSAPSWQTISALTSGTFITTSGTAVDFTDLPSGVKRITVILNNVSISGTANLIIQIGTSSGFITSGYGGSAGYSSDGTAPAVSNNSNGFKIDNFADAGATRCGIASLCLLSSTRWIASSVIGNSSGVFVGYGGGTVPITGTLDRVRITADGTQTFDQGTVNIFYEA